MSRDWKIEFADATKRLDVFLTEQLGVTRAQLKKQIEAGAFTVNGKPASVHRFLKEGDVIAHVEESGRGATKSRPSVGTHHDAIERARLNRAPTGGASPVPLQIIRETKDWIVLYKPSGVLMHPDHGHETGTLVDAVLAHAPQVAKIGEDPGRPGIMSRLDKDVSGLVVIAKTQDTFEHLKRQFGDHTVTKEYMALVHGVIPTDEGDLKFRLARSTSKARMAARPATGGNNDKSQAAWTHYDVVQRFMGATLVRLQILTGRTHQIRAHLHAFGHPVIGDTMYQLKQTKRKMTASRVMLQSVKLAFTDPATGERVSFEHPLDPEFAEVITQIS